ncbi:MULTISPECIES: hypothetical protein [unclassified Nitratiruptor]|uniref:hypothetical protein n=1 Tax=unclassified Nitratiruptor TaxID=2624044 RepID=UPI001915AC73|nr:MULTISPECIES: hypothetical protein [unclassified Nitratiruptor]BCD59585.1 hypothetical protein NitYY0810_C0336 [Nitratiruptor sp. YY08-10]BCD63509.1 hypothetical protein NitYY0814_C0336 [Nitratiruptor sp. YY08-14]BCD83061.1 hypothetical protein NrS2_11 [Nitratiruptor phage NrS-2]BCD83127.1 hypothetical protein NrS3_11 [Nitratiruptor phage NrS-3]
MFEAIHHDLSPIDKFVQTLHKTEYVQQHNNQIITDDEAKEILEHAKHTLAFIDGFVDIIDDLTYDKSRFEELIFKLDDDYDMLKSFTARLSPVIKSHAELLDISNKILDKLMIAQRELGLIIANNENKA